MLCKCSSGHTQFSIDFPAKIFPVSSNSSWSTFKIDEKSAVQKHICGSFFARTRVLQFWRSCHFFPLQVQVCLLVVRQLQKARLFTVNFSHNFPLHTLIAVSTHQDSFFAKRREKFAKSPKDTKKTKSILKKNFFPQPFPLDALMTLVTTLKKTVRPKGPNFWLIFRRSLKHCAKFQTRFILNTFQGYISCSFDNSGELLRY